MALTIGQLARRWAISRDHVRQLLAEGRLQGAFAIPSAGRYGAAVKIPLESIVQAETSDWLLTPETKGQARPKPPKRGDDGPALRHFPALAANPEPASGCPGAAPG
jgi:hypothetical protein